MQSRVMALRFCANLNFLFTENEATLIEKYRRAHQAGFKGVEGGFPRDASLDEILKVKNDSGLEQVLLNICTDKNYPFGCSAIPSQEDQFEENLDKTIKIAKALNCKKIHVMSGKLETEPKTEHFDTYLKNLKIAAKKFEQEKLLGVIEPINRYAFPGYYLNSFKTAVEVLNQVNSPNLKLMVDVYHLQHIQGNVAYTFKELMPYVGHIQIAQVPNRDEPSSDGELNYRYILKIIQDAGYTGWIGCEYKPKSTTVEGLSWVRDYGYQL